MMCDMGAKILICLCIYAQSELTFSRSQTQNKALNEGSGPN